MLQTKGLHLNLSQGMPLKDVVLTFPNQKYALTQCSKKPDLIIKNTK